MNSMIRLMVWMCLAAVFQGSIYYYLDQVVFAPAAAFKVAEVDKASAVVEDNAYFSFDNQFKALVYEDRIDIYRAKEKKLLHSVPLGTQQLSFFRWLNDRNLALMAVYGHDPQKGNKVTLTQINPLMPEHDMSTVIDNLPRGSKIADVAFSTATNVIYMQVKTASQPDLYRIYRTDANHDLTRVSLQSNRIGKIALISDEDDLIYDDIKDEVVYLRNGDGSWRVISPGSGSFRLLGVDKKNTIYIAKMDKNGLATAVYRGRLRRGFELDHTLNTPTDVKQVSLDNNVTSGKTLQQ